PGPRRGARELPGNPAGDPDRVDLHGVRAAEVPHVTSGAGVHPGDPALEGLGLRILRRRTDGGRPYPAAPGEARRGPRPLHRDRPGSGVPLQPRVVARFSGQESVSRTDFVPDFGRSHGQRRGGWARPGPEAPLKAPDILDGAPQGAGYSRPDPGYHLRIRPSGAVWSARVPVKD